MREVSWNRRLARLAAFARPSGRPVGIGEVGFNRLRRLKGQPSAMPEPINKTTILGGQYAKAIAAEPCHMEVGLYLVKQSLGAGMCHDFGSITSKTVKSITSKELMHGLKI